MPRLRTILRRCTATSATFWSCRRGHRAGTRRAQTTAGPLKLEDSQAAAAVGQIALARTWTEALSRHGITAGQVLVTLGDTEERRRYLNARSTIDKLLEWRAVPVINENDTVATTEIRYGDNDRLAARVATMVSADLLVLLSDVDGLYDAPPGTAASAKHVPRIERITPAIEAHGGRRRIGTFARRHADQDRSGQDRHRRRHAPDYRLGPRRPSAAGHCGRRAVHVVSGRREPGHGTKEMDRGIARTQGHAHHRRRRRGGAAARQQPAAGRRGAGGRRFRARRCGDHSRPRRRRDRPRPVRL